MALDKLLVLVASILGIGFTYWFFLMKKTKNAIVTSGSIDITVDGGYQPESIVVPKGRTTQLRFTRKDPSSCLEEVVLGDFKIRRFLPLNKTTTIDITPQKKGEFIFTCGMNMFHGVLKVT